MRSGRRPVPEGGRSLPVTLTTDASYAAAEICHRRGANHRRL